MTPQPSPHRHSSGLLLPSAANDGRFLNPWTPINQSNTWAPTSAFEADRAMECGQACIVMCLKYCSGVWTSAAYLDQLVHDPGSPSATSLDEMVATFALMETRASISYPQDTLALRTLIKDEIDRGHPLIPLRYWDHPGNSLLHFTVITGYSPTQIEQAGPGYGIMFAEDDATFWSMYAGALILVHRKRMLGDH